MGKGRGFSVKKWWLFWKWLKVPDTKQEISRKMAHFSIKQLATPPQHQLHQIHLSHQVICKGDGKNPSLPAACQGREAPKLNTSLKRK